MKSGWATTRPFFFEVIRGVDRHDGPDGSSCMV